MQIKFVPTFSSTKVIKSFFHFEKMAQSLKWPKEAYTLLLHSDLVGKACTVYYGLLEENSGQYKGVKMNILIPYELVPEACKKKFRNTKKTEK